MTARITLALVGILLVASAASAGPVCLLGVPGPAAVPVMAGPPSAGAVTPSLDRNAIFEILCGGTAVLDPALRAHLWQVAGSLAARSWTPPKVTVRVVIRSVGR